MTFNQLIILLETYTQFLSCYFDTESIDALTNTCIGAGGLVTLVHVHMVGSAGYSGTAQACRVL